MELLWTDGAGEEDAPLITADMAGTVLGVLSHTVVAVPVTFRDGGQLRLQRRRLLIMRWQLLILV